MLTPLQDYLTCRFRTLAASGVSGTMLLHLSLLLAAAPLTHGAAPVFLESLAQVTLKRNQTGDLPLYQLKVQDPDNGTFTCQVDSATPSTNIFQATTRPGDNGVYWLYFLYGGPGTVNENSYSLELTCSNGTDKSGVATVTVDIINNAPPTLTANYSSVSVSVDIGTTYLPQSSLHVIGVQDTDGDTLTCTSSAPSGFYVTDGCVIKNTIDLRSFGASSETFTISLSDGVNAPVIFTVYLTFTRVNHAPAVIFPHDPVTVAENVVAGSTLFTVSITDDNSTPRVSCSVTPTADTNYFDITFTLPTVTIKLASGKAFDFERGPKSFLITCSADDNYRQTTASVTVVVLDVNEAPYFQAVPVQITVSEGPANTVSVLPLYNAVDPEGDVLTYQLVSGGTYSSFFSIRTSDGALTNQQALDRDNSAVNPTIQVTVSDGKLTATTTVIVYLTDINDNRPSFNQTSYDFKVGLSSVKGNWVGGVGVTDLDAGNNGSTDLVMTSGNPSGYFRLESDGSLFLIKDLDVGYGTVFTLNIKATDNGSPVLSSTSVITVTWQVERTKPEINEEANTWYNIQMPEYAGPNIVNLPAVAYCHEDLQAKTKLFDLSVLDTAPTQVVCVKDESRSTSTSAFDVMDTGNRNFAVMYTGAVSLAASPDVSTYDVAVRCFDRNGEVTKVLKVDVTRNAAPVFTLCNGSATTTVDAWATNADDIVYTISVTDADNDPLRFSVVSTLFYVGTYTGVLRATNSLRYVTANDHLVSITVKDIKHTSYCSLIIKFTNVNKVPVFSNLDRTVTVPETALAGSDLYVITVTDQSVSTTDIDITWTSADKNKFALIVSRLLATVRLGSGQKLDYESGKQTYSLTFTASDGYLTSEPATLTIVVTPVNEPPYFAGGSSYYTYFEEISSKIAVLGCNTRDPDVGDTVTLSLSGTSANLFTVRDLDNCQVNLIAEYDLDKGLPSTLTLGLIATDSGGLSASAELVVRVVEINDNTPQFAGPVTLTMYYGMRAADPIGTVAAVDIDVGTSGAVYYSVQKEPANADVADNYISFLSNGSFIVRQSMDNIITSAETFQYVILATDGGAPQRSSSTTVNILYNPFMTTTTTTAVPTTSTTQVTTTTAASTDTSPLSQPLFIGMLAGLIGLAAIITAAIIIALCKYFNANKSFQSMKEDTSGESPTPRRSSTPLRPNRISVHGVENQFGEGRKISRMVQLPLPSVH